MLTEGSDGWDSGCLCGNLFFKKTEKTWSLFWEKFPFACVFMPVFLCIFFGMLMLNKIYIQEKLQRKKVEILWTQKSYIKQEIKNFTQPL